MASVLIVDDDRKVCKCLAEQIDWAAMGFQTPILAHDGLEALEKMETHAADLVICDLRMPVMDGILFCNETKNRWPDVDLIIFSAYEDFTAAQTAVRCGVKDYIMKPINRESLSILQQRIRSLTKERQNRAHCLDMLMDPHTKQQIEEAMECQSPEICDRLITSGLEQTLFNPMQSRELCRYFIRLLYDTASASSDPSRRLTAESYRQTLLKLERTHEADTMCALTLAYYHQYFAGASEPQGKGFPLARAIKKYLDEHFCEAELSLDFLAEHFGYHPDYLGKQFNQLTGTSIRNYLIDRRMKKAEQLLTDTWISVNEIARLIGYEDPNYFTKLFRKKTLLSPSEYRQRTHQNDARRE